MEVKPSLLEAFRLMWGNHPGPVLLIHKSRQILAVNDCARELGVPTGISCHTLYPSDTPCPGCLANLAVKKGEAVRQAAYSERTGQFLDGYWVPVQGEEDIYVHFGNDISEYVKPELLHPKDGSCLESACRDSACGEGCNG